MEPVTLVTERGCVCYSQSGDDVPGVLYKFIQVSHLTAFSEFISQVNLQVV